MRKIFWIVFLLLIVSTIAVFIFIPSRLPVAKVAVINSNSKTIYRCLADTLLLHKLLKGAANATVTANSVRFDKVGFQFKASLPNHITVAIAYNDLQLNSVLNIVNLKNDSSAIEWRTELPITNNPIKRVQQYYAGVAIKNKMTQTIEQLKNFVLKKENIYGTIITPTKIPDTLLLTLKINTTTYPAKEEYYSLIKKLQDYAAAQNANVVNYPMLNITMLDSTHYETMAALPVNKEVPHSGAILFKRMVAGNVLTTEVAGGRQAIENGFSQLSNYAADNLLYSAALPFQLLITNRLTESDPVKWKTKLYAPIY